MDALVLQTETPKPRAQGSNPCALPFPEYEIASGCGAGGEYTASPYANDSTSRCSSPVLQARPEIVSADSGGQTRGECGNRLPLGAESADVARVCCRHSGYPLLRQAAPLVDPDNQHSVALEQVDDQVDDHGQLDQHDSKYEQDDE